MIHLDRLDLCPIVVLSLFLLLVSAPAVMPANAQETQVPFDRDSTVYVIDQELQNEVGLFPEISGFREALLYRTSDGEYELVLRYEQDGIRHRERRELTSDEVRSLRHRVTQGVSQSRDSRTFTQDGRYNLMAATTIHGLVQGSLLAGAFGMDGGSAVTLPALGASTGFFVPLIATQDARVTDAEADMTFYGGLQGYAHAVQLSYLLGGERVNGRATAGLAAVLGAGEGVGGYLVARHNNWSTGHGKMVSFTGLTGNFVGLGVSGMILGGVENRTAADNRTTAGTTLLGSFAGAYLGHRMGRTNRYSKGDARIYFLSIIQTANLAGSFLSVRDDRTVGLYSTVVTGSVLGGGILGRRLVRDREFTAMDGSLVALGTFAGSLLGLAITSNMESGSARTIAQALGSTVGFGITYTLLEEEARQPGDKKSSAFKWDVNVVPTMADLPGRSDGGGIVGEVKPRLSMTASF